MNLKLGLSKLSRITKAADDVCPLIPVSSTIVEKHGVPISSKEGCALFADAPYAPVVRFAKTKRYGQNRDHSGAKGYSELVREAPPKECATSPRHRFVFV